MSSPPSPSSSSSTTAASSLHVVRKLPPFSLAARDHQLHHSSSVVAGPTVRSPSSIAAAHHRQISYVVFILSGSVTCRGFSRRSVWNQYTIQPPVQSPESQLSRKLKISKIRVVVQKIRPFSSSRSNLPSPEISPPRSHLSERIPGEPE